MWNFLFGEGNFSLGGVAGGVTIRLCGGDFDGDVVLGGEL